MLELSSNQLQFSTFGSDGVYENLNFTSNQNGQ